MKDINRFYWEASNRSVKWAADHPAIVAAAAPMVATKFTLLGTQAGNVETLAGEQMGTKASASSEVDQKAAARLALRENVGQISDIAEAAENDNPGVQAIFAVPRNLNDADLLALAHAFITAGNTWEDVIKNFGMPASWIGDLTTLADAFEAAIGETDSAQESKVGKTAGINNAVKLMAQTLRTLKKMVPIACGNDVEALASWESASHVERPKKKDPTPPPTP
jgi:hypothetical protein